MWWLPACCSWCDCKYRVGIMVIMLTTVIFRGVKHDYLFCFRFSIWTYSTMYSNIKMFNTLKKKSITNTFAYTMSNICGQFMKVVLHSTILLSLMYPNTRVTNVYRYWLWYFFCFTVSLNFTLLIFYFGWLCVIDGVLLSCRRHLYYRIISPQVEVFGPMKLV